MGCDWLLKRRFGENPDQVCLSCLINRNLPVDYFEQKWDSYLAHYAQNLPDRAGQFQPLASLWTRLFGSSSKPPVPNEVVFPTDEDLKSSISTPLKLQKRSSISKPPLSPDAYTQFQPSPTQLKKGRSQRTSQKKAGKRSRDPIKFGADLSSSDSDSDEDYPKKPLDRPWLEKGAPSSIGFSCTLRKIQEDNLGPIDVEKELAKIKPGLGGKGEEVPEYSDFEEDVTSAAPLTKDRDIDRAGWSPEFLRRHRESGGSSTTSQRTAVEHPRPLSPPAPDGAVPVTPSLLNALNRIAVAQETAYDYRPGQKPLRPGLPPTKSSEPAMTSGLPGAQIPPLGNGEPFQAARWDTFWQEVRDKAGNGR